MTAQTNTAISHAAAKRWYARIAGGASALPFSLPGFVKKNFGRQQPILRDRRPEVSHEKEREAMENITKETRRESYQAVLPTLTARQKTVLQIFQ